MLSGPSVRVLESLGLRTEGIVVFKDVPPGNGSWLVQTPGGASVVLRRYHAGATRQDLSYEHAVLRHLASAGWVVPDPVGEPIAHEGSWYCPTRYVPGRAIDVEAVGQRRLRGRDLARLHLALRGLDQQVGQRPGWRAQHSGVTVLVRIDWPACAASLAALSPRLGSWAHAAAARTHRALAALGADELPVMVVHGDFAEWNVHYQRGCLAGVIDFGLTHLDSRPYELALARTHRSPQAGDAYRAELARNGWPLSKLEEAAIEPIYHAVRVDMVAWHLDQCRETGRFDMAMIERQLSRTGTAPP